MSIQETPEHEPPSTRGGVSGWTSMRVQVAPGGSGRNNVIFMPKRHSKTAVIWQLKLLMQESLTGVGSEQREMEAHHSRCIRGAALAWRSTATKGTLPSKKLPPRRSLSSRLELILPLDGVLAMHTHQEARIKAEKPNVVIVRCSSLRSATLSRQVVFDLYRYRCRPPWFNRNFPIKGSDCLAITQDQLLYFQLAFDQINMNRMAIMNDHAESRRRGEETSEWPRLQSRTKPQRLLHRGVAKSR